MAKIISLNKNHPESKSEEFCENLTLLQETAKEMQDLLHIIEQSLEKSATNGTKNIDCRR